ncbi:Electron transfer flavoprotein subunit alpha [wastewater metagenome]|uniref:Electron transfer flavoprotein subunit alpha n=2 Tax=unclassified sequences TaxID=12908 RepID=A0A5B8RGB3_9ZZZZ|nr:MULTISPECIES: FAD-binding protein [Arhodomonas]QEA06512.1 electron transfer flavoprotein subunit alpha [uncultured organism]
MSILLIAEHDGRTLGEASRRAASAARQLGEGYDVLVIGGPGCVGVADAAAGLDGAVQVLLCEDDAYADDLAEPVAERIATLVRDGGYDGVVAAGTSTGKDVMPRVAGLLDVAMVSDAVAVENGRTFIRPIYAGNALARVRCEDVVRVVTVRTSAFDSVAEADTAAPCERLSAGDHPPLSRFVDESLSAGDGPDLANARVVISGGRGLGGAEAFDMLRELAAELGAAVGASRAAVDAGYIANDCQVGQTGKIVAPELYLAVGISGAIQHLAGMKDSRVIAAINRDEEAPIFQVADYALVGDLFEAVPQLLDALRTRQ